MGKWLACVEWETPEPFDEGAVDFVLDGLSAHCPVFVQDADGTCAVSLEVQARSVRGAVAAALGAVTGATGETPIGVAVRRGTSSAPATRS